MIRRITSALLTVCMIVCLSAVFCVSAAPVSAPLTAGETYPETSLTQIGAESGDIILVTSATQNENGIVLKSEVLGDKKSLKLSYSGTPIDPGTTVFRVSYTDGGTPKEIEIQFSVGASVQVPDKPVVNSVSPSTMNNTVKQTDPEINFEVNASGNGTLSYEWIFDGAIVSTSSKYTFTPAKASVGDHYLECVITNTIGDTSKHTTTDSPGWSITVEEGEAPKITSSTSAAEIKGSGTVKFTVEAEGTGLTYQWYVVTDSNKSRIVDGTYGAVEYSGGTESTLKVTCTGAPSTVTTKFVCEVTNASGMTSATDVYTLYVTEDPSLSKVQSISVSKTPSKTTYTVGETLDTSGMAVSVVTGKGTDTITDGFACSPLLLETEGTQKITVSYGGKTTTFNVTVKKADHTHEWSEWQVDDMTTVRVFRECTVEGCTSKEIFTKEDFVEQYPDEAKKLGLEPDEADDGEKTPEEDGTDDTAEPVEENTDKNTNKKKTGGNGLLWGIIIVAAVLLAAACVYYVKVYRKPYKKPKSAKAKKKPSSKSQSSGGNYRNR